MYENEKLRNTKQRQTKWYHRCEKLRKDLTEEKKKENGTGRLKTKNILDST